MSQGSGMRCTDGICMGAVIDHDNPEYRRRWERLKKNGNCYNGAFYYSKEIVANIIPRVRTDRNWVTVNQEGWCLDHSIVFVHNNLHPEHYEWLRAYDDLVLVCGIPETCRKVRHLGAAVYLPLSVDVGYVRSFAREKDRDRCFAGRMSKLGGFHAGCDVLSGMKRQHMLPEMARYRQVYAVGRTAIEAKVLGCEVLPYDPRFPDPSRWKVLDNAGAASILQGLLDGIDG